MNPNHSEPVPPGRKGVVRTVLVTVLVPLVILAAGVFVTSHFMKTSPKAVPRQRPVFETLVQAETIQFNSEQTVVTGMGSVIAAREMDLKSRVGGDIVYLDEEVVPGGVLAKGQIILKIDPADYQLRVDQLESEVARAEADLVLEMGNQRVAQKEFEMLGEEALEEEKALMLRLPQLRQKEAALKSSRSKLDEAALELERTTLKAPFDSVVRSKSVELGSRVTESTPVARLIGTDSFWVQVGVPVDKLDWITFPDRLNPEGGSVVRIYARTGGVPENYRSGRVVRLAADLEEGGRMAKVIVAVDDPLSLLPENQGRSKLFLGSYVRVEIEGRTLDGVYPLKRAHLRDNNTIWLLSPDSTLEIRPVSPIFKGPSTILLKDEVTEGEKLIVSTIPTPVAGMKVRLEGSTPGPGRRGPQDGKSRANPAPSGETAVQNDRGAQKEGEVHARQ
ncbi:MAG: efflux RND transporter periplasmic adaptor subunit [Desulfofustis sp.]|nr:efflux RND transporter periplasmic adaptor subunit [Desulfofustis sp.]